MKKLIKVPPKEVESAQCDVTDLEGNHCPETPIHWVVVNGQTVHLCEKCYTNVLNGAYKKRK
jgi:hypothetical protein